MVAADARIDDRAWLFSQLGVPPDPHMGAATLIALAWAKWGADALDRLIGDFAFVVLDQSSGTVHLARDFMSRRPLHYRVRDRQLCISSLPSPLADPSSAVAIEPVARHLALFPQSGAESFFRNVERVEPGTVVRWRAGHLDIRQYWHPPLPTRQIGRHDAVECAAAILRDAAADRLAADPGGGALQLSGGMDSSLVAVAVGRAGIVTHVISGVAAPGADPPPSGYLPEDGAIAAETAARFPSLRFQRAVATPRPWQDIVEDWNLASDQPFRNYENIDWIGATARAAADSGASTLLTGDFGNDSLSHDGTAIFAEDLRRGRLSHMIHEGRALRRLTGARWRGIALYAVGHAFPAPLWRGLRHFPTPISAVAETGMFRADHPLLEQLVARARADHHDLSVRPPASCWDVRSRMVGWVDTALMSAAMQNKTGVVLTDPTADRRLVDFSLSLPADHWFADGRQRAFARNMLAGHVPDAVVNPTGRGLQGCDWRQSAEPSLPWLREEVRRLRATPLGEALDLPRMERMLVDWPRDGWSSAAQLSTYRYALMRAISMGHFARVRAAEVAA